MSSILESLKKSQQLRPDEGQPASRAWRFGSGAHHADGGRRGRWPLLLGLLFLLALLAWGFADELRSVWQSSHHTTPPPAGQKSSEPSRVAAPRQLNMVQPQPGKTVRKKADALNPDSDTGTISRAQSALPRPDPNQARASLAARQRLEKDRPIHQVEQGTNRAGNAMAQTQSRATEQPAQPTQPAVQQATAQHLPSADANASGQKKPGSAQDRKADQHHQAPQTRAGGQKYRYLYQLPFSLRKQLPALSLSIHVYDQNPEHRLVVINGLDLGIGDTLEGSDVVVKDILPEGALLQTGGEVFLLPTHR